MKRLKIKFCFFVLLFLFSLPSHAFEIRPNGGLFGAYALGSSSLLGSSPIGFGGELYVRLHQYFGGGAKITYINVEGGGTNWLQANIMADFHFIDPEDPLDIYIGAGFGASGHKESAAGLNIKGRIGADYWLLDHIAVSGSFELTNAEGRNSRNEVKNFFSGIINLGARFRF